MSSLSLDVTVPCDGRYLPVLRRLTARTVEYIGFHEAARASVVETIDCAMAGVFTDGEPSYSDIGLRLATTENDMLVRIRYLGGPNGDGAGTIESLLSRTADDGAPLERLRRGMKTVVLGRESGGDGAEFCELTHPLPKDPA
jgi:hypothetical protein